MEFLSYNDAISDEQSVLDRYYDNLCLAKYIFSTLTMVFARNARSDQVRVQLWHGCGFKFNTTEQYTRFEYKYEYMTVTSKLYAEMHERDFGLRANQLLVTGYPKDDLLFHPIKDWRNKLSIPAADKYIF